MSHQSYNLGKYTGGRTDCRGPNWCLFLEQMSFPGMELVYGRDTTSLHYCPPNTDKWSTIRLYEAPGVAVFITATDENGGEIKIIGSRDHVKRAKSKIEKETEFKLIERK